MFAMKINRLGICNATKLTQLAVLKVETVAGGCFQRFGVIIRVTRIFF